MAKNEDRVVARELRDRNDAELRSLLTSKSEELHQAKTKKALGQLRETHVLRSLRRDVSKLKTVLSERRVQATKEQQA